MYIIVVGGGKVGYNLAKHLLAQRHEVLLIERDKTTLIKFGKELGEAVIEGDGSKVRVLRAAGAERADVVVAATGEDQENLVICQVAKHVFHCPRTICRVTDPKNEAIFSLLGGIDVTISAANLIDSLLEEQVEAESGVIPLRTFRGGGLEMIEVDISGASRVANRRVAEIPWPEGVILLVIIRGDEAMLPKADTVVHGGDKTILLMKREKEQEVRDLL